MDTIYSKLMAKAAEWRDEADGLDRLTLDCRPEEDLRKRADELEAFAKQVCADALEQCRACSWADGLDMGTDRVVALDTMKEIIGGPLPESFVTTTETRGAGDLLIRRDND